MHEGAVHAEEEYDILATSAPVDDRTRVLKHGDTFGVFDRFGDIEAFGPAELGIYHEDTRFLSRLRLRIEGQRPLMLDSTVSRDDALFRVDLMNADVKHGDDLTIPHGTLHLYRAKVMWKASCYEHACFHNYSLEPIDITFTVDFAADFADLFEIRGMPRARRGRILPPRAEGASLVFAYEGLDGRDRRTRIVLDPAPEWRDESTAVHHLRLEPHAEATFRWEVACELGRDVPDGLVTAHAYESAVRRVETSLAEARAAEPEITTSSDLFNGWVNRSLADIHMLTTDTPYGPYPYAGVPWYNTAFGRDGIVTALEYLWVDPSLARGVLAYLAANQAGADEPERDAQPGKILHETRAGEMANLGEVPFSRYYGSVDSTPLFVMLAGAYLDRTGDLDFVRALWPHVERALAWIDTDGDPDGDGFYEYERRTRTGLLNQGWKDSYDSVFHADGTLAEGPIALCEVQGYVYAARLAAARLAVSLGLSARAEDLARDAEALRARFEAAFWCDDIGTYALALDGRKRPCKVVTSNAGHCLYTGIASDEHARAVAQTLLADSSFSGWGIRTVGRGQRRYNPMSYHDGSVWPHDNAIAAAGFSRYGLRGAAVNVLTGLFDASVFFDLHRLPELFCGFRRRPEEGPTIYPVACSPQAWAAASVFLCVQACLGLEVRAAESTVTFSDPVLPPSVDWMHLRGLRVGEGSVDLVLTRRLDQAIVSVEARTGDVRTITMR